MGVLHLTTEAGVFGDIGGESKLAFDNCCLEKEEKQSLWEKQRAVYDFHTKTVTLL